MILFASDYFTGQPITLPAGNAQAVNITINVTEGENVTFMCEIIPGVTLTLNVRLPGGSFVAALPGLRPPNLRLDGGQTFTFLNAQRRDNGIAFQCRGDGRNTTDIGVISVQCKLCNEAMCTEITAPFMHVRVPEEVQHLAIYWLVLELYLCKREYFFIVMFIHN